MDRDISNFKDILTTEEEKRQAYEKDLSKYDSTPVTVHCELIDIETDANVITKYALYKLDGTKVYESGKYTKGDHFTLDIDSLNLIENTQLKVTAIVSATSNSTSNATLIYVPNCHKVVLSKLTGRPLDTSLEYVGIVI